MPSIEERELRTLPRDRHQWVKMRARMPSYIGMIPCEHTSAKRQRLGKLSQQGNSLLRYLWTEAARLITKRSAVVESCGSRGQPMRGCLISTVVLHSSDRVN